MILALLQDSERDVRVRLPRCLASDVFVSVGQLRCLHEVCVPASNLHVENLMLLLLSSHIDMIWPRSNHHIQLVANLLDLLRAFGNLEDLHVLAGDEELLLRQHLLLVQQASVLHHAAVRSLLLLEPLLECLAH